MKNSAIDLKSYEVWFAAGSQHLYGEKALQEVAAHARAIAEEFSASPRIPVRVVFKPVVTTSEAVRALCEQASLEPACVGLVAWMHTFSPAKMWIAGLQALRKPLLDLHTQYNREIPWATIDMDFMNLNQTAHGGREFGFIATRLRRNRKVVVGFWRDEEVQSRIGVWAAAACAWADQRGLRVARFGDNMREVAVTEGDKVEAQMRFGYSVNGYGLGDLATAVRAVEDAAVTRLVEEYEDSYQTAAQLRAGGARHASLREAARIELGLRSFLETGGCKAFTTTFEDLHGLQQLPGLAVQRLMADGYGFGAEGDWKTAALLRAVKVMGSGLQGGASFMEDYTYHLDTRQPLVLGAHMLEVCPTIGGSGKASLEIHELGIGGKADPVRLVFTARPGPALNASLVDMGNRFRLVVNAVQVVAPSADLPRLPVARVVWQALPELGTAAAAWILAGGAHHTAFSQALGPEYLEDFADMADVEFLLIGSDTRLSEFKKELRWNEVYYHLRGGV